MSRFLNNPKFVLTAWALVWALTAIVAFVQAGH